MPGIGASFAQADYYAAGSIDHDSLYVWSCCPKTVLIVMTLRYLYVRAMPDSYYRVGLFDSFRASLHGCALHVRDIEFTC